ncbi:MAG: hypothetical protein EAZ57_04915 [Cytophagales bacterium]|nr:MAG: hypothetical protein EAZ67_00965 [Cytophagales bacterium]TAF61134.1 MAG: hypothetical protein EAZ57_04915 [Cytophagales bacterium]
MKKNTIFLELSLEEANMILKSLGQQPFNQVYELIGKINAQANDQLRQPEAQPSQSSKIVKPSNRLKNS